MYSITQLLKGVRNPALAARELNILYHTRGGRWSYNYDGINIFDEDWDNLLILDAFRYDVFKRLITDYNISGRLESRISAGSATPEFLRGNIHSRKLRDTVYLTATTMLYREGPLNDELEIDIFKIEDVWQDRIDFGEFAVSPETMSAHAIEAIDRHPDKRLVVHYIQPHIPFIGPTGKEHFGDIDTVWSNAIKGELDVADDLLWEAYEENARIALEEITSVVQELDGKTVITSDHGQMIGDRGSPFPGRLYGHPSGVYIEELVKVPWFICDFNQRRSITADSDSSRYERKQADNIDEKAREHLRKLGYIS